MSAEARAPAGEKGTADRIEADEGMFWVCLVTRQALDREGAAMQHCVGDGDYDALVGGEELHDDAIWSLRRADGSSALTVRVRRGELDYARGFSNHGPGKGACLQVRHLAAAFAGAGYRLAVDEDTGIVLLDDGRTFRRDRLPPEVVAAREAAERARRDERAAGWRRLRGDIEIRTDERPDRPLVGPGEVPISFVVVAPFTSWVMESNPDGEPIGGVGRLRFEFRATRGQADPVVRIERDGEGPIRYRTRAGVQFELAPDEFSRPGPDGRLFLWDPDFQPAFLQRYREAVRPAGAAARRDRAFARLVAVWASPDLSAHLSNMLTASTEGRTA